MLHFFASEGLPDWAATVPAGRRALRQRAHQAPRLFTVGLALVLSASTIAPALHAQPASQYLGNRANTPGNFRGSFDNARDGTLVGWAIDGSTPEKPVQVVFTVQRYPLGQATVIGATTPNIVRPDVNAAQGKAAGAFGFAFRIPDAYRDGRKYYVTATAQSGPTKVTLPGSPKAFAIGEGVELGGAETVVFDHAKESCEPADIPDSAAHVFRDIRGNIELLAAHEVTYRMIGPDFDHLRKDCSEPVMRSDHDPDPSKFEDQEWVASPYTPDGKTVYAIIHDEYHPWEHKGGPFDQAAMCGVPAQDRLPKCWYNDLTYAVSNDAGRTFTHPAPPAQLLGSLPYRYEPEMGKTGLFGPSNIVHNEKDGYFYAMAYGVVRNDGSSGRTCLFRTKTLNDPKSWRAWNGSTFDLKFHDPYRETIRNPEAESCTSVVTIHIARSLTFNRFLGKWLVVGDGSGPAFGRRVNGFYYALSDDLIHWSEPKLIVEARISWTDPRVTEGPITAYPSLIDQTDTSRNFEYSGRDNYLYYTLWEQGSPWTRNLVRIPIRFAAAN